MLVVDIRQVGRILEKCCLQGVPRSLRLSVIASGFTVDAESRGRKLAAVWSFREETTGGQWLITNQDVGPLRVLGSRGWRRYDLLHVEHVWIHAHHPTRHGERPPVLLRGVGWNDHLFFYINPSGSVVQFPEKVMKRICRYNQVEDL